MTSWPAARTGFSRHHARPARHHPLGRGVFPGRAWIMVCAEHLTTEHLIGAMQRGKFYATAGVLLEEVKRTDRTIEIAIQAEPGVRYSTRFIGTQTGYDPISFPVTDADGRTVRTARRYSADIGSVLGEADGTERVLGFKYGQMPFFISLQ